MFGIKKRLKEIEEAKYQLEKEKNELLFIKNELNDSTPKIDVSNIYVWHDKGIYNIVRLNINEVHGRNLGGYGKMVNGYHSTLTDIFTNNIVYEKCSQDKISNKELVSERNLNQESYYAYLFPIHDIDRDLLAYTDKKVPLYVLQQLYYRMNNVDVNSYVLTK